jgi:ribosomal protein S27E
MILSEESRISEAIDTKMSERSYLYSLEPIGLGTSMVEGLQSYMTRLAREHCVTTHTLLQQGIFPRVFSNNEVASVPNQIRSVASTGVTLNSMSPLNASIVETLEALTLRRDLSYLTMLPWRAGIAPLGMMRKRKAWCAACYREWMTAEQELYEPLMWSLTQVVCCPVHRNFLECRCPDCGSEQPLLTPATPAGYCAFCKSGLSSELGGNLTSKGLRSKADLAQDIWAEEQVGTLLAAASSIQPEYVFAPLQDLYLRVVASQQFGERIRTTNNLGVRNQLFPCRSGSDGYRPSLALLLRLCKHINLSVLGFLTGVSDYQSINPAKLTERPPIKSGKAATLSIKEQEEYLHEVLVNGDDAHVGIADHARRMGCSREVLHRHFPGLCAAIAKRGREHRRLRREELHNSLAQRARAATLQIYAEGEYPSANRVSEYLGKPGCMRIPVVQAAWRETLSLQDLN